MIGSDRHRPRHRPRPPCHLYMTAIAELPLFTQGKLRDVSLVLLWPHLGCTCLNFESHSEFSELIAILLMVHMYVCMFD